MRQCCKTLIEMYMI